MILSNSNNAPIVGAREFIRFFILPDLPPLFLDRPVINSSFELAFFGCFRIVYVIVIVPPSVCLAPIRSVAFVEDDGGDVQTVDLDAVAVGADQLDAGFFVTLEGRDVDTGRRGRKRRKSNEDLVCSRLWLRRWLSCSGHRRSLSSEIRSWQLDISVCEEAGYRRP